MKNTETYMKKLAESYQRFDRDHDRLREQMLDSLPVPAWQFSAQNFVKTTKTGGIRSCFPSVRTAVAAAVLFLVLGGFYFLNMMPQTTAPKSQMAFAGAVQQSRQLNSIHIKMVTPGGQDDSSVEVWWVRPNKFRMEFSGGLVLACDGDTRYKYVPETNSLTIWNYSGPELEMLPLSETGHPLFVDNEVPAINGWLHESKITSSEDHIYKGEKCLKISSESTIDDTVYEYILDKQEPVIYDVKRIGKNGRIKSHTVVLERDVVFDNTLFRIKAAGKKIIDNR